MKSILLVAAVILIVIGGLVAFPAFLSWTNIVFSGDRTNAQGVFTQFVIGGIIIAAGQGLWKLAGSLSNENQLPKGDIYHIENASVVGKNAKLQVKTKGGTFVSGDINNGNDFIGRDKS